jgi:hypothetical protein
VARIDNAREIQLSKIQKEKEIELAALEQDRRWKLDLTDFLFRQRDHVFPDDPTERERVRNVPLVAFPNDITAELFRKLEVTVPEEEKATWRQGQDVLVELEGRRVFVHITAEADRPLVRRLANGLKSAGFEVPGIEVVSGDTNGDVRYFHPQDSAAAEQLKELVEDGLQVEETEMNLEIFRIARLASRVRPGTLELWLPPLSKQ